MPQRWDRIYKRLTDLFDAFPDVDISAMGFPENWKDILK